MGLIARLLEFTRVTVAEDAKASDVKVNPAGGANVTAKHFANAGDDSFPLKTDYVALVSDANSGGEMALGYLDPINEPMAQEGEKRIYARNPEGGAVIVEVWLQNDGTATVKNAEGSVVLQPDGAAVVTTPEATFSALADGTIQGNNASGAFELQSGGDFVVNGVTIDTGGNITSPAKIEGNTVKSTTNNITLHSHNHGGPGPVPGT